MIDKHSKIYIAGHLGLVGASILHKLQVLGYNNLIVKTHSELDLLDQSAVEDFFVKQKPEYVIVAAAKVGGIMANKTFPAEFVYENLQIQNNLIHQSYLHKIKKLLFLGSSCIYPKFCPQPIREEYLLTGPLESSNEPYAIAKISGIKMCQSYNRQYGTNFVAIMPTNLYGAGDNFDPLNSHVIPALLRKFHEAKTNKLAEVEVWGTGEPYREFLFVDDLARASIFVLNNFNPTSEQNERGEMFLNVGTGFEVSIRELVQIIKEVVGFPGEVVWDTSKPDGTPRKLLDTSRLNKMGWNPEVGLKDGLKKTYDWYLQRYGRKLN